MVKCSIKWTWYLYVGLNVNIYIDWIVGNDEGGYGGGDEVLSKFYYNGDI